MGTIEWKSVSDPLKKPLKQATNFMNKAFFLDKLNLVFPDRD